METELDMCKNDEFISGVNEENRKPPMGNDCPHLIYIVLIPAVCLFGSIGASISLFIFTRKQMRSSLNTYLAALSFFDLILLSLSAIIYPTMDLCIQEGHQGNICHFFWTTSIVTYPISLIAQMASVWTCVAITVDRFLAVKYPLRMRIWRTPKYAKGINFLIILVTIVYKVPSLFELTLDECGRLQTTELRNHSLYLVVYNTYGYLLFLLIIPFLVIIILNISVILSLREANAQRQQLSIRMSSRTLSICPRVRKQYSASCENVFKESSRAIRTGTTAFSANDSPTSLNKNQTNPNFHKCSEQTGTKNPAFAAAVSSQSALIADLDVRCTKMAIITISTFLMFNSLAGMNNVIEAFQLSVPLEPYRTPIGNLLVCVNSASNILIYSIYGSQFRRMCAQLFNPSPNYHCVNRRRYIRGSNYELKLWPL